MTTDATALVARIADAYSGTVDGPGLVAAFRDAVVVVPTDGNESVLTFSDRGIRWVPVFTDTAALARFAVARGDGKRPWPYLTTLGFRVQDAIPARLRPAGIAVDIGSQRPMFFPPTEIG